MVNEEILLKIKKIMEQHKGKANQISAGKIAKILDLKQEDTHVEPREYIYQTIKKYRLPIAGGSKGYYFITNKTERDEYLGSLKRRIKKIEERKQEIRNVYNEYYSWRN